jgi:hypothetical protein
LGKGNHRFVFGKDGSMWLGKTHLSWVGGQGVQRIKWNGKTPMEVESMKLTDSGFALQFTKPLANGLAKPETFAIQRYYYAYRKDYGSPQHGREPVPVTGVQLLRDGRTVIVSLAKLNPGYVYQLDLNNIAAADGSPLVNGLVCYTLNRLTNGDDKAPHLVQK